MKRLLAVLAATAATVASAALLPSGAGAAAGSATTSAAAAVAGEPFCGIRWGSLPKRSTETSAEPLVDVRAGRHRCFDRLVLDIDGPGGAGYDVRYVTRVTQDGSGNTVPVRGGARIQIVAHVPAYDDDGDQTLDLARPTELVDVSRFATFRQVAWAGSFEGSTTLGLGVRARLPFRVFELEGPGDGSRLVVDVAHRW